MMYNVMVLICFAKSNDKNIKRDDFLKKTAFIYIILAGMLWGTSGIYVHFLAPMGLSSSQMTCIRGFASVVILSLYALLRDRKLFIANPKQLFLYVLSGVSMYLTGSCYFTSMQLTSVSTAVVLMYTAPIIVMIYSVIFLGEKLTPLKTVAVICMIVGCGFVSGIVGGLKFNLTGIIIGFISGIAYSAYNIVTKIQMKQKCNPVTANIYCFVFVSIIALAVSKPWQIAAVAVQNPSSLLLMAGCGICTCVLPYFFYTLALKSLPAGTVSAMGIVEPMAATIFSITLLGEKIDIYSVCGIILIVGAVFMLSRTNEAE